MDIGSLLNQAGGVSAIARQLGVDEATVERARARLPHVAKGVETKGLPGVESRARRRPGKEAPSEAADLAACSAA